MTLLVPLEMATSSALHGGKGANLAWLVDCGFDVPRGAVVVDALRQVWASTFSENVRGYLRRGKLDPSQLRMAVVVQRQLDSRASGVAFGDRSRVTIEATLGQGTALVSGEVVPDHWEVEEGRIRIARVAAKTWRQVVSRQARSGTLTREAVPEAERNQSSLDEGEVLRVAELCRRVSDVGQGRSQDCEFAFAEGRLFLLQTRDVTASLPVEAPRLGPWTPPGKGAWELDKGHFPRPSTRLFQDLYPAAAMAGAKTTTERYGSLLSHAEFAFVNEFAYSRLRHVSAPEDAAAKDPPPRWLFNLARRIVPSIRRRLQTAERIWEARECRVQMEEWSVAKGRSTETNLQLQRVDLARLDAHGLRAHFRIVCAHVREMIEQHHSYNLAALAPTGDLMAHVSQWTHGQVAEGEILSLLAGSTPISAELRSPEARAFGLAVDADPAARRLLRLDEQTARLDDECARAALIELKALDGMAGQRAREFLAVREYRLVEGQDPAAPCLHECPALLWRALRTAAWSAREAPPSTNEIDPVVLERCRRVVPIAYHPALDELIVEARLTHGLRDERALYSDMWAWGILRTIVLHIGQRLIARSPGCLGQPSDLIHASTDEIERLLLGGTDPSARELQRRAAFWRTYSAVDAPLRLGPPQRPPAGFLSTGRGAPDGSSAGPPPACGVGAHGSCSRRGHAAGLRRQPRHVGGCDPRRRIALRCPGS